MTNFCLTVGMIVVLGAHKIVPIHADNGRKKSDKYYEVIKNSKGNKLIVAHKSRHPSALASGSGESSISIGLVRASADVCACVFVVKGGAEEMKKNGRSKDGGKKDSGEKEGAGNGGGDEVRSHPSPRAPSIYWPQHTLHRLY